MHVAVGSWHRESQPQLDQNRGRAETPGHVLPSSPLAKELGRYSPPEPFTTHYLLNMYRHFPKSLEVRSVWVLQQTGPISSMTLKFRSSNCLGQIVWVLKQTCSLM